MNKEERIKKISLYLRQPFADHICSALIMTEAEEAGGDGSRQEFIPLPASCLQIAFLHPSWSPPRKRAHS